MNKFAKAMFFFLGLTSLSVAKENIGQHRLADPGNHKIYADVGDVQGGGRAG